MGKRREKLDGRSSQTLPPSPSHSFSSSSSSDFEFTISLSPRKSSTSLCPADELFYKGQLLPLHLSPRISMVRTLLLSSSSTSSDTTTTASRDSTGSSSSSDLALLGDSCDSSRPSSVADQDDDFKRLNNPHPHFQCHGSLNSQIKKNKYFSLSRFSSVFKKEPKNRENDNVVSGSSVKRMGATAKEVIRKYLKKVKAPLYDKLSQKQQQQQQQHQKMDGNLHTTSATVPINDFSLGMKAAGERSVKDVRKESSNRGFSHSFSGNLRYPRRKSCVSSCPSSMRSSPSHSGVLCKNGSLFMGSSSGSRVSNSSGMYYADTSTMEELQSAIQGAIAHCKNSLMIQNKTLVSTNDF